MKKMPLQITVIRKNTIRKNVSPERAMAMWQLAANGLFWVMMELMSNVIVDAIKNEKCNDVVTNQRGVK